MDFDEVGLKSDLFILFRIVPFDLSYNEVLNDLFLLLSSTNGLKVDPIECAS
jgi:hypothetical protein